MYIKQGFEGVSGKATFLVFECEDEARTWAESVGYKGAHYCFNGYMNALSLDDVLEHMPNGKLCVRVLS